MRGLKARLENLTLKSDKSLNSLEDISDGFKHSAEALTYNAFLKHKNKGFEEAFKDYFEAYKLNSSVMWSKSKKKIVSDFSTKSTGKEPIYKKLLVCLEQLSSNIPLLLLQIIVSNHSSRCEKRSLRNH